MATMSSSSSVAKSDTDRSPAKDFEKASDIGSLQPPTDGPPNGGLLAWSQILAAFFLFFNPWGLVNSYGAFQTFYGTGFINRSASDLSWIGTFQGFLLFLVGILTGPIFDLGYFRQLVIAGTFLLTFGMMMTSLSTEYYQLFLAQGVVIGLGAGCLFVPSVAIGPQYFTTKKAIAVGITASGGSLGGVLYPIIFHRLQPTIGFGWATRVIGFICLATLLLSLALIKPRVKAAGKARKLLDLSAFKDPTFLLFTAGIFLYFMGLYFPFFYLSNWAVDELGTDPELAFYLFSILNAGSILGRIIPGLLADKFGSLNIIIPCLLMTAILGFSWIGITSFGSLVAFAVLYGFSSGACVSLPPTIVAGIAGDMTKVGTWMGMCFSFAGLGLLIGNPIAGTIIQNQNGSYVGAQAFSAACVLAGCVLNLAVRYMWYQRGKGLKDKV